MSAAQTQHRIVWLVLLAAQAVYVVVAFAFSGAADTGLSERRVFPLALGAVALTTGFAAHVFWRRASGASLPIHHAAGETPERTFSFFVVAWALDESVAIYGLVLALLGFPVSIWPLFSVAAAVLLLLHRPTTPA